MRGRALEQRTDAGFKLGHWRAVIVRIFLDPVQGFEWLLYLICWHFGYFINYRNLVFSENKSFGMFLVETAEHVENIENTAIKYC